MISRVNLLAVLITLSCVVRALEGTRPSRPEGQDGQRGYPAAKKTVRDAVNKTAAHQTRYTEFPLRGDRTEKRKVDKGQTGNTTLAISKNNIETREHPRRRKRKMDRTMMALLMAYKMKFVALIPTMMGGLILLKATALLAGFFFSLFAAVLGLKIH